MMTLEEKIAFLRALFTTGLASQLTLDRLDGTENPDGTPKYPGGVRTETIATWFGLADAAAVGEAAHSTVIGAAAGLVVDQKEIPSSYINRAVMRGYEFPNIITTEQLGKINFGLVHPTFDMSDEGSVQAIEDILKPYYAIIPDEMKPISSLTYFRALKTKHVSPAEYVGGLTQEDIYTLVAPVS